MDSRKFTINFAGTVDASANKTFASRRIGGPYIMRKVRANFDAAANSLVKYYFYISKDAEVPTATKPQGTNILSELGQEVYLAADDQVIEFAHEIIVAEGGTYIKLYVENGIAASMPIAAQVTIELFDE